MLSLKQIQDNPEEIIERLALKNMDARQLVELILSLNEERKKLQVKSDAKQAEMNRISKEIGNLFKSGQKEAAERAREETGRLKEEIKTWVEKQNTLATQLDETLVQLPNLPSQKVPKGTSAEDNKIIRSGGDSPVLKGTSLPHWGLAAKYDIIDFELGNKLTGSGFPVYKGKGARLQRALISFFLDENINAGYDEVIPPLMVNEDSGFGTGQLPDKEGQMYRIPEEHNDFYLIPTAEVPVTNIYRDVMLSASDFPVKKTAYTPCFRREAGSYGKDVRGLNRLHQFDKVEIVQIQHPEKSYIALEEMVAHVESIILKLGLPYRVLLLCGGDMSFTSALTYDFEVFSAAQERWLEVSSVSNFEAFQANRLKLRFKEQGEKKAQPAHTLNGSSLALPRIVAALLENNQTEGGILIPEVLRSYTGFDRID